MSYSALLNLGVQENVELCSLTTFAVPARARWYARVESIEALQAVCAAARQCQVAVWVLGGGSNVLFTRDFDGLVLHMAITGFEVVDENDTYRFVRVGAGENWNATVERTLALGWCGLENLASVPGSVGGAAVQNIGAYGVEVAERIREVECFDPDTNAVRVMPVTACDYGYRTSVFKTQAKGLIVTSVVLALPKVFEPVWGYKELAAHFGDSAPKTAIELALAVRAIRSKKLPDPKELGNAGSFFKNPIVSRMKMVSLLEEAPQLVAYPLAGGRAKLAAGWLIEAVGMKGRKMGRAAVYERQALVLVNTGGATGAEIQALAEEVQLRVKRRFGVDLQPEPVIL